MRATAYLKIMVSPWRYNDALPVKQLRQQLGLLYGDRAETSWYLTANGRSALELLLLSIGAKTGDEVIVQAFTCVAAVNPILWAGLKPVFVDIDAANLSLSIGHLKNLITPRTKAIIVQHSFGIPGPTQDVIKLAQGKGIVVIEDCAHALGAPPVGPKLGTDGDATILSFGIEKTLSTKFGGALMVNNPELATSVEARSQELPRLNRRESLRWLLYPIIRVGLRRLSKGFGRSTGHMLERIGLLRQAVSPAEYEGGRPPGTPARLPGVHAKIILDAVAGLDQNLVNRTRLAQTYRQAFKDEARLQLPPAGAEALIKYPLLCATSALRDHLYAQLVGKNIPVSNWYDPPLYPVGVDLAKLGYDPAAYPIAQDVAARIICLPTGSNISPDYATVIANELITATTHFSG
jgi:perosamine synthetase